MVGCTGTPPVSASLPSGSRMRFHTNPPRATCKAKPNRQHEVVGQKGSDKHNRFQLRSDADVAKRNLARVPPLVKHGWGTGRTTDHGLPRRRVSTQSGGLVAVHTGQLRMSVQPAAQGVRCLMHGARCTVLGVHVEAQRRHSTHRVANAVPLRPAPSHPTSSPAAPNCGVQF